MRQFTLAQRLRYKFDNTMSKGPIALIGWLAALSALLILSTSLFVWLLAPLKEAPLPEGPGSAEAPGVAAPGGAHAHAEPSRYAMSELLWMSLLRTLDPGTMGPDSGSALFLGAMLTVTLGGIFIVSTLIGVLTAGVGAKVEQLRKGRSLVVETNHTVILGWSEQVFTIVSELVMANQNQKHGCVVIMSETDKVEMEDLLRQRVPSTANTRVVCRKGNPIDITDLDILNLPGSKSIIVLSPETDDPDPQVIKTILAITNNPSRRKAPYHIVAEIHDSRNMAAARLVGGTEVQFIETSEVISRVLAQTSRQSGLSIVYTELLDFGGDELYFQEEPGLVGRTFAEALVMYEDSCVIGLQFADGRLSMNPAMGTLIAKGDKVIAISEDDDTVRLSGKGHIPIDASAFQEAPPSLQQPERALVLGWNRCAPIIINELDHYVAPGSEVHVVADTPEPGKAVAERCANLKRQRVSFEMGDTTDRPTLDRIRPQTFDHVIVLCYSDTLDAQRADARTLVTLLHLRDIQTRTKTGFSIVSEMLDVRNRRLAQVTQADDFIVSERLISLLMTQVSENRFLYGVFDDIFHPEGCEIFVKPAGDYVKLGVPVNFYTVVAAARRRNHVAIGYRIAAESQDPEKGFGVRVNPDKSPTLTFLEGDQVIVVSEE